MPDFSVRFEMPYTGSMAFHLLNKSEKLTIWASHTLYPTAPQELVLSLSNVLAQKPFSGMSWFLEPGEYHFEFRSEKDITTFQVNEPLPYEKVKTHFEVEMSSFELVLAFWRGLRCIQAQVFENEFQKGWYYPFPDTELAKLTEQLREAKRKQA